MLGAAPCILYFAANGAAADLWYATFGYNLSWAATQSFWLKLVPPLLSDPLSLLGGAALLGPRPRRHLAPLAAGRP